MHALIVVSHPVKTSLTHSVAAAVARGITDANRENSVEIADLAQEGFNPAFSAPDYDAFQRTAALPPDVVAEQARIDNADALVLVYPVYWWSMPGMLKGWIDRVFANGWAYEERSDGRIVKKLTRLPVHLIGLGGAGQGTYEKHGYSAAMRTQIDHGIFDYCGAPVVTSEVLFMPDLEAPEASLALAQETGRRIFTARL